MCGASRRDAVLSGQRGQRPPDPPARSDRAERLLSGPNQDRNDFHCCGALAAAQTYLLFNQGIVCPQLSLKRRRRGETGEDDEEPALRSENPRSCRRVERRSSSLGLNVSGLLPGGGWETD